MPTPVRGSAQEVVHRPLILVVGAGIAGLATVQALSAAGCDVEVLERRREFPDRGAGITLWPNALKALDQLGIGHRVREASQPVLTGGIRRPDGSWRHRLPADLVGDALGEPLAVIGRGELLHILGDATGPAPIHFGVEAATWRARRDAVELSLTGDRAVRADAVVAADGIHSVLAAALNARVKTRYAGYTAWRGVAPRTLTDVPAETWGAGSEFGYLPMTKGRTYWFATRNLPERYDLGTDATSYLQDRFGDWHQPIPSLIGATDPTTILRDDVYDRAPLATWSQDRLVLVGDAAHPMRPHLGQGGCQAIEDAVVLGRCVAASTSDLAEAFARFERARRRAVGRTVRRSARLGRIIQGQGLLAALERAVSDRMPDALTLQQLAHTAGAA